jgi:hypothetical protein
MEYGILVAHGEYPNDGFQIVGAVASIDEARELAHGYIRNGPENNALAPDRFTIHRRGQNGFYSVWEPLAI